MAETVSDAYVVRRMLMGGTLTGFIAGGRSCVFDRGGYIDTLLGPERTRECFLLGKITTRLDSQSYRRAVVLAGVA